MLLSAVCWYSGTVETSATSRAPLYWFVFSRLDVHEDFSKDDLVPWEDTVGYLNLTLSNYLQKAVEIRRKTIWHLVRVVYLLFFCSPRFKFKVERPLLNVHH